MLYLASFGKPLSTVAHPASPFGTLPGSQIPG
jgi:hypothetical protein